MIISTLISHSQPLSPDIAQEINRMVVNFSRNTNKPPSQHMEGCSASRDIIQTINLYHNLAHTEEHCMPSSFKNKNKTKQTKTNIPSSNQVIDGVKVRGTVVQSTDSIASCQTIQQTEIEGSLRQKKRGPSEINFPWGRASGWGVLGLVIVTAIYYTYRYFSAG